MNATHDTLPLAILAATAGLWWPARINHSNLKRLRKLVGRIGVPWSTGRDPNAREEIAQLARDGRVVIDGSGGAESLLVRLVDSESERLRAQVTLSTRASALPFLDDLLDLERQNRCRSKGELYWVRERDLAGAGLEAVSSDMENCREAGLAEILVPLTEVGLVESRATIAGKLEYALLPAGRSMARDRLLSGQHTELRPTLPNPDPVLRKEWVLMAEAAHLRFIRG